MEIRKFFDKEYFTKLREYATRVNYGDVVNDVDGVVYPDVSTQIPAGLEDRILRTLTKHTGRNYRINKIFWRAMLEGTPDAPHQAHTDTTMGRFTFILYMNPGPEGAGTALVQHKEVGGLHQDPWTGREMEVWEQDCNDYDKWQVNKLYAMEPNKAVFYHSKMMHRAEPPNGFGKTPEDGRLVLTAFLD